MTDDDIIRDISRDTGRDTSRDMTSGLIRVIGRCAVASCRRPASHHLVLSAGAATVAGSVCQQCGRASRLALFLLETTAA